MGSHDRSDEGQEELVRVETCSTRVAADLLRSVLEGSGIDAYVRSDDCGSVDPTLALVRGVGVLVAANDFDRARAVLAEAVEESGGGESPSD